MGRRLNEWETDMSETTQRERDLLRLGWDRNGPLCRALNDADRLAAIERRVRELVGVLESDAAMAYEAADYGRATGYRHSAKKLRAFLDMSGNNDRG